jgi:hypothetical protein
MLPRGAPFYANESVNRDNQRQAAASAAGKSTKA